MASRELIILSLLALAPSLFADTAADYVNRAAQKYIFGQDNNAAAEIDTGLAKFPDDPELREMAGLVKKKKTPPQKKKQQKKQKKKQQKQKQKQQQQKQQKQKKKKKKKKQQKK